MHRSDRGVTSDPSLFNSSCQVVSLRRATPEFAVDGGRILLVETAFPGGGNKVRVLSATDSNLRMLWGTENGFKVSYMRQLLLLKTCVFLRCALLLLLKTN